MFDYTAEIQIVCIPWRWDRWGASILSLFSREKYCITHTINSKLSPVLLFDQSKNQLIPMCSDLMTDMIIPWYNRLRGRSTGPFQLTTISGRMVALVARVVRLNMGEIGNTIVFSILLSRKCSFYNNFFF